MSVQIIVGDCRQALAAMETDSIDSCVCDPPYHLTSIVKRFGSADAAPAKVGQTGAYARASRGFMGQTWDGGDVAFDPETWAAVFRVLKPGAHLVAFSGTRTYHRMVCAIEDAGFEIRDQLAWIYGSGFPKSHDVSKGIDKMLGAKRETVPVSADAPAYQRSIGNTRPWMDDPEHRVAGPIPASAAAAWQGWGTALKPAWEPICLARKPLCGTVAANVLQHGTGAINVDGCRVRYASKEDAAAAAAAAAAAEQRSRQTDRNFDGWGMGAQDFSAEDYLAGSAGLGRWPANILHDGSEEVLAGFPDAPGAQAQVTGDEPTGNGFSGVVYGHGGKAKRALSQPRDDTGSAARFFYCAKAASSERGEGNSHPTVKPIDLMRWLCMLVTPKGGTVLDPFAGSGSTLIAADREQFNAIGIELSEEYADIARRRITTDRGGLLDAMEAAA